MREKPHKLPLARLIICGLGLVWFGTFFGASVSSMDSSDAPVPTTTVTVTTTETQRVDRLPASCMRALELLERIIEDNAAIASAGEKQLDISHAARQAIFTKDWQALDKTMNQQTDLNNKLDAPAAHAMQYTLELKALIKECRNDLD